MNGYTNCGTFIQWNIIQQPKEIGYQAMRDMDETKWILLIERNQS